MPLQINIGDHVSSQPGYIAIPGHLRGQMNWARSRARAIASSRPAANVYFRALPGGRALSDLLADGSIWVNYTVATAFFGETNFVGGKEIAISSSAFRIGRWTVLATLIHELAHSNGAAGGADRAAEEAVLACGLGHATEKATGVDNPRSPYDPNIGG